jgi:hypothetical protein
VQGENARLVSVATGSRIGGGVQVVQGKRATVRGSRINGDIQFDEMSRYLGTNRNPVGGSIQVIGNSGGAEISRNVVSGNLQYQGERAGPTGD